MQQPLCHAALRGAGKGTNLLHDDAPGRHVEEPDETRPDGEGEEEQHELHPSGALVPIRYSTQGVRRGGIRERERAVCTYCRK